MLLDMHMIGIDYVKKKIINNTKKLGNNNVFSHIYGQTIQRITWEQNRGDTVYSLE